MVSDAICRCTLHKIQFLKFEVAPVLDLRVTRTDEDCTVEMLSCRVSSMLLDLRMRSITGSGF